MATSSKKRIPRASVPAEPPRWRAIAHALASDLLALTLLLKLADMATEDEERVRHVEAARRALSEGERRWQALHEAVHFEGQARDAEAVRRTAESGCQMEALRQSLQRLDAPAKSVREVCLAEGR